MNETKTKHWEMVRVKKKTKYWSSSHLLNLAPLLFTGWVFWTWLLVHGGWHDGWLVFWPLTQKRRLYQVSLVLLNFWQLPFHLAQHITQCLKLVLLDIFPLWVPNWEIDSTGSKTPKVSNV